MRVFPVSAQKGLVAKVQRDEELLQASRLPLLEEALIELLVPAKQKIVRDQTIAGVERVAAELRQTFNARERNVIEQLYELRSLQGKNQSSIERMTQRALSEQREFEESCAGWSLHVWCCRGCRSSFLSASELRLCATRWWSRATA